MQRYLVATLLWVFALMAGAVEAPQPHSPATTAYSHHKASMPVRLDGEVLFDVRGIKSLTATRRAEAIAERIQRLADDPYLNLDDITVVSDDISADLLAKDRIILSVFGLDVAAEGITRQERATQLANILRSALLQYRKAHSYERLASGVVFTLLATLALGLFLRYFNRFYAWLESVLRACELFNFAAALSTNLYFAASGLAESDRLPIGLKVAVNRTKWAFVAVFPRIIVS